MKRVLDQVAPEKRVKEEEAMEEGEIQVSVQDLLGIDSFGSTKNSKVKDNFSTAARGGRAPKRSRKAQQYMNRKPASSKPPKPAS
ncbi:hypothetical protein BASA81_006704 [Batrachochytrium salamandrivorans]|nr:hypothetical protein BASA81_006704 [Batrachochytrium salamandrivorans]